MLYLFIVVRSISAAHSHVPAMVCEKYFFNFIKRLLAAAEQRLVDSVEDRLIISSLTQLDSRKDLKVGRTNAQAVKCLQSLYWVN